jgi:c-di-GMP-binding flagellar brake protein YcgR
MAEVATVGPFPDEEIDKYRVASTAEMVFVLRSLIKKHELVTVYFNGGRDFIVTSLLEADPHDGVLIFDRGSNEATNQRLLQSNRQVFVAISDGIKIQFTTSVVGEMRYEDRPAFVTPMPGDLIRLQRREYYRVSVPLTRAPHCLMPHSPEGEIEVTVHDISVGGVGLEVNGDMAGQFEVDQAYSDCQISLNASGTVTASLEVRHVDFLHNARGDEIGRIGSRFGLIDQATQGLLQRFVIKCERERIALMR